MSTVVIVAVLHIRFTHSFECELVNGSKVFTTVKWNADDVVWCNIFIVFAAVL